MSFRLVALDLDGTLLRSDKTLSERCVRAIEAARRRGVRIVFASGRRYPSAVSLLGSLAQDAVLVLHNGALIMDSGSAWSYRPLSREIARRVVIEGRAAGADPVLHGGSEGEGHLWVEPDALSKEILRIYLERAGDAVQVVTDLLQILGEDPLQVMFGGGTGEMRRLEAQLRTQLGAEVRLEATSYVRRNVAILDVLDPGAGKAEALARLQARWKISPGETLAIGDNGNDRDMLLAAGLGLVMANAEPPLLKLGLPKVPGNDEDGVAVAVERYVLAGDR